MKEKERVFVVLFDFDSNTRLNCVEIAENDLRVLNSLKIITTLLVD